MKSLDEIDADFERFCAESAVAFAPFVTPRTRAYPLMVAELRRFNDLLDRGLADVAALVWYDKFDFNAWELDPPDPSFKQTFKRLLDILGEKRLSLATSLVQRLVIRMDTEVGDYNPELKMRFGTGTPENPRRHEKRFEVYLSFMDLAKTFYLTHGLTDKAADIDDMVAHAHANKVRKPKKRPRDKREMTEEVFWSLIDASRSPDVSTAEVAQKVAERLSAFKVGEVRSYYARFHAAIDALWHHDLWAVGYIVLGGLGDDQFEYLCGWVIGQGRSVYERVLSDPGYLEELINKGEPPVDESMHQVPWTAYEYATNKPALEAFSKVKVPVKVLRGTPWNDEDLPKRYPELCERYRFS